MTAKSVVILPIAPTSTEVDEMMSVTKKAFGPDPLIEFCFNQPNVPHPPKEESIAKHLERMCLRPNSSTTKRSMQRILAGLY